MLRLNRLAVALCTLAIVAATSGCDALVRKVREKAAEKVAEEAAERGAGGNVSVDLGRDVDVSDLDKAFRYPGAKAKIRMEQSGPKGEGTMYAFETTDSLSQVVSFYEKSFKGYTRVGKLDTPNGTVLSYQGKSHQYAVTVASSGAKTAITIFRAKEK
jgi:hypothetical protein